MLPLCTREGIGTFPWSPLARGFLTRSHESFPDTTRGEFMDEHDRMSDCIATYYANGGDEINERAEELAAEKGVTMAQIALSWLLHRNAVTHRSSGRRASTTSRAWRSSSPRATSTISKRRTVRFRSTGTRSPSPTPAGTVHDERFLTVGPKRRTDEYDALAHATLGEVPLVLGIELTPEHPLDRLVDLGTAAETAGYDTVFVSSHYNNRSQFAVLSRLAAATETVRLGPGVVNPL